MPHDTMERLGAGLSPAKRALLEARLRGQGGGPSMARHGPRDEAPPSFAQERLWFLHQVGQGAGYVMAFALRLRGALDVPALERALGEIVRRHEILRTTFREADGLPVQVIHPFAGLALPVEDLSGMGTAEREAEVARRVAAERARPVDLVRGPLFAPALLRLGEADHVLLLTLHHIVTDGWSLDVLTRELWDLYGAFREGRPSPLPELPVQYADFAAWQREQSGGEADDRRLAYWKERLAGAPVLLELPSDRPRPPAPSFRGGTVPVSVPPSTAARLRALARGERATPFMVVLAAFQVLLGRYAGTDDFVVGTPVAGRTRNEVQGLIGLFMNTLVLRADLAGDPTFREVVGRVRETVLGAYEHGDLPFERLVEALQLERSLSHSALFQVLFQLEEGGGGVPGETADAGGADADGGADAAGRGLRASGVDAPHETAKFDLSLLLWGHGQGMAGVLEYSADLFERGTVRRMAEHLEQVLEQVAADPGVRLSRLALMGRAERARVLEWNRTTARYPAERCIHQLFEAQAARTPDAPAVLCGGETLTFAELDARANRLAHHLRTLGVGPETRVGLLLERGPELMVAILGAMKAGGAYVPMDTGFPAERIAYVLGDSGVRVLMTQDRLRAGLPADAGLRVLALDGEAERIAAHPATPPETGVTSENLCYVIYTSGSTGRPKGVAMHHRGVANYIHWGIRFYGADRGSGAPVFTSMAVDLTITNLLPLFAGHPVRMLPEESPVEALAETLRGKPGFGLIKITPIHLGLLNALLDPAELAGAAHTLVVGADFLSAEPTVPWQEHAPGVRLMNEYGPTETVVGCSAYVLPTGKHRAGPVPVGHPIQNLAFYVLDAHGEPVPVGLPGELYIGGAGVARGYLGRPALTAEKFVPDPFAEAGARMYRTGDRARWQADGNLLILGRTDNQVKIRGYRVELGEVEAVLRRHPDVAECLAVARDEGPGDRRLVAYVTGPVEAAALREHALASLPEYMVPSAFVVLDALPQTSTGKLDRRALPAPDYGGAGAAADTPRSFTEVQLLHIWEELLGVPVGPTQDFFALGGNSLLALRLFAQIRRRLGCELPLATLFAGATVRGMADAVLDQRAAAQAGASPKGAPVLRLQPSGTLPPLFCIHPAGPEVYGYVNLVRHLGAEQPVLGVRDVGDDLGRPLAQIAREHVAAVRRLHPEGPYRLLGWSFGGYLAYEMASELERQGERADFVGVLDTPAPGLGGDLWPEIDDAHLVAGLAGDVAAQMGRPFSLAAAPLRGLTLDAQLQAAVDALHAQGAAPRGYGPESLRGDFDIVRSRAASQRGYVPGPFSGRVTVFRAAERGTSVDPAFMERYQAGWSDEDLRTLCWCRLLGDRVDVQTVPGSHVTLGMEPHVRELAARLRAALAAADARAAAPPDARVPVLEIFP